jgi:hypothetical protein
MTALSDRNLFAVRKVRPKHLVNQVRIIEKGEDEIDRRQIAAEVELAMKFNQAVLV